MSLKQHSIPNDVASQPQKSFLKMRSDVLRDGHTLRSRHATFIVQIPPIWLLHAVSKMSSSDSIDSKDVKTRKSYQHLTFLHYFSNALRFSNMMSKPHSSLYCCHHS